MSPSLNISSVFWILTFLLTSSYHGRNHTCQVNWGSSPTSLPQPSPSGKIGAIASPARAPVPAQDKFTCPLGTPPCGCSTFLYCKLVSSTALAWEYSSENPAFWNPAVKDSRMWARILSWGRGRCMSNVSRVRGTSTKSTRLPEHPFQLPPQTHSTLTCPPNSHHQAQLLTPPHPVHTGIITLLLSLFLHIWFFK